MSKFDYINEELAKFREEGKKEWQIRQSARMLGDKRNKGKVRTPEVREKLATLKKGNKNRKGVQKKGPLLIEIKSKKVGRWLDLKKELNITFVSQSGKEVIRNRRLIEFSENDSYRVMNYPSDNGLCFMYYEDYKFYLKNNDREPSPLFEYPQLKEIKSGIIGDTGYIKSRFPDYTQYYLNKKYSYKRKDNPWKNGEEFVSCSKKIGIRKYEIREDTKVNIKIKEYKRTGRVICQLDEKGNEINRWNKIKDAAQETGISAGSIQNVAAGRAKTAGGYKFKYI